VAFWRLRVLGGWASVASAKRGPGGVIVREIGFHTSVHLCLVVASVVRRLRTRSRFGGGAVSRNNLEVSACRIDARCFGGVRLMGNRVVDRVPENQENSQDSVLRHRSHSIGGFGGWGWHASSSMAGRSGLPGLRDWIL
jgi:hypothetical protein